MNKITKELLKTWSPCADGYKRFIELFPDGATLQEAIDGLVKDGHDDWAWWLFCTCKTAGVCTETTRSGYRNSGGWNSGDRNSGQWNSGHGNSGDGNSGDGNSGDGNSGHGNSGDGNSGHWNSGHWNSGDFNRDMPPTIRVFEKECPRWQWLDAHKPNFLYFPIVEWVDISAMTEVEKKQFQGCTATGGFLRRLSYKEAFKQSWDRADPADRIRVRELPNFDAQIFYDISGIDLREGHGE